MDAGVVGNLALWAAIAAGGLAALGGLIGRNRTAAVAGVVTLVLATAAIGALVWCLLTGNFAVAYVADTTTRQGGWPYRLAGLWGGNGGSLVFWAWIILVAGWLATRNRPGARLVAVATGASVLVVAAVAANPFARLAIPAIDGGGLNPILRYSAMLYHPPVLYAGHAGLAAPFALAIAGLAGGKLDREWMAATRRWMLGAWLLLGAGLVAGAHWSYVELGWGGFWAWDPVENGGLLPLLAATAFLHGARHAQTDDEGRYRRGLAGLATVPFCLSLLGATLSRSGAAESVHAFAQATAVGRGLLVIFGASVFAVMVAVYRRRRPGSPTPPSPRDAALLAAVAVLLAMVVAITVGTAFPALAHSVTGDRLAVTGRYYAIVLTPLTLIGVVLMGIGPSRRPNFGSRRAVFPNGAPEPDGRAWRTWPGPAAAVAAGAVGVLAFGPLGGGAAFALVLTAAQLLRAKGLRRAGALLTHLGITLLLIGVAGSLRGHQATQVLRPGSTMAIDGFGLRYRELATDEGSGWRRVTVIVEVSRHGRPVAVLRPGLRVFKDQAIALSDVSLQSSVARDLILAVRQVDPASHAAQLEVTVRPLVTLVWWGGLLAAAGGGAVLAALARHRRPDGAPSPPESVPGFAHVSR